MKIKTMEVRVAALVSLLLVLPLALLELFWNDVSRRSLTNFPWPLFGVLWVLPLLFTVILLSLARDLRTGRRLLPIPISGLSKVVCLVLIAGLWFAIVKDQLPCFLAVPNCD